jgi:hypothetical protein
MIVKVTQEDIDHGEQGDCYSCPIARALQRTLNNPLAASDGYQWWFMGEGKMRGNLPKSCEDFVERFDGREEVFPFEFEIEHENS